MKNLAPTAGEVLDYITNVELPARQKEALGSSAKQIIQYGAFVGSSVEYHARLGRAMDHGRLHIDTEERSGRAVHNGRVILAGGLSGSKGRFSRSWHAPEGGLWGCLIHGNTLMPQSAMLLSLAVGIAACEAVRQEGVANAAVRWVNDVLSGSAKLAGFLIESHTSPVWKEQFHLIGFGINVNNTLFPAELRDIASSLCDVMGRPIDLKNFTLNFIAKLVWNIGLLYFTEAQQPDVREEYAEFEHPIITRWKELTDTLCRKVKYGNDVLEKPQYSAYVTGIEPNGGLQMVLDDGTTITEHSGEIRYL